MALSGRRCSGSPPCAWVQTTSVQSLTSIRCSKPRATGQPSSSTKRTSSVPPASPPPAVLRTSCSCLIRTSSSPMWTPSIPPASIRVRGIFRPAACGISPSSLATTSSGAVALAFRAPIRTSSSPPRKASPWTTKAAPPLGILSCPAVRHSSPFRMARFISTLPAISP